MTSASCRAMPDLLWPGMTLPLPGRTKLDREDVADVDRPRRFRWRVGCLSRNRRGASAVLVGGRIGEGGSGRDGRRTVRGFERAESGIDGISWTRPDRTAGRRFLDAAGAARGCVRIGNRVQLKS